MGQTQGIGQGLTQTMGATSGGYGGGGGYGKENKKPPLNQYKEHPKPQNATMLRQTVPEKFSEVQRPNIVQESFVVKVPVVL